MGAILILTFTAAMVFFIFENDTFASTDHTVTSDHLKSLNIRREWIAGNTIKNKPLVVHE